MRPTGRAADNKGSCHKSWGRGLLVTGLNQDQCYLETREMVLSTAMEGSAHGVPRKPSLLPFLTGLSLPCDPGATPLLAVYSDVPKPRFRAVAFAGDQSKNSVCGYRSLFIKVVKGCVRQVLRRQVYEKFGLAACRVFGVAAAVGSRKCRQCARKGKATVVRITRAERY
jgi:hypothetical protein